MWDVVFVIARRWIHVVRRGCHGHAWVCAHVRRLLRQYRKRSCKKNTKDSKTLHTKRSAGVAPGVNLRIPLCTDDEACKRRIIFQNLNSDTVDFLRGRVISLLIFLQTLLAVYLLWLILRFTSECSTYFIVLGFETDRQTERCTCVGVSYQCFLSSLTSHQGARWLGCRVRLCVDRGRWFAVTTGKYCYVRLITLL